jgi:hypothetical protein
MPFNCALSIICTKLRSKNRIDYYLCFLKAPQSVVVHHGFLVEKQADEMCLMKLFSISS